MQDLCDAHQRHRRFLSQSFGDAKLHLIAHDLGQLVLFDRYRGESVYFIPRSEFPPQAREKFIAEAGGVWLYPSSQNRRRAEISSRHRALVA